MVKGRKEIWKSSRSIRDKERKYFKFSGDQGEID